jgi:alpha-N-arabinofuranosidase
MDGKWAEAPHLIEEVYNLEDALVCAQYLNAFIRHADVVKIACIAQVVNIIAPLLTKKDGLLIQSIYHPFAMMAQSARGKSLRPALTCPTYAAGARGDTPVLDVSVSLANDGELAVFAVNRSQAEPVELSIHVADAKAMRINGVEQLSGNDPKAANSWENPNLLVPQPGRAAVSESGDIRVTVPALGFVSVRSPIEKR